MRRKVLKGLLKPNTPTELAKTIGVARSAVSRAVIALEKVGLVECLTPDENIDRYYRTTDAGKKLLRLLKGKGNKILGDEVSGKPSINSSFVFC